MTLPDHRGNGQGHEPAGRHRTTTDEISDARVLSEYGSMDVGWRRGGYYGSDEPAFTLSLPPRDPLERDQTLQSLAALRAIREQMARARGGPFPSSAGELAELRAERERELP